MCRTIDEATPVIKISVFRSHKLIYAHAQQHQKKALPPPIINLPSNLLPSPAAFPLLNLTLRLPLLHLDLLLHKTQTHTINTMPLIRRRLIPLPLKHMTQMAPTIRTYNLRPRRAHRPIHAPLHGPRDAVKVRGPAAAGRELVGCGVQGRGAPGAGVGPGGGGVLVVFPGSGGFGTFLAEDVELF